MTRPVGPWVALADPGLAEASFDLVPEGVFFLKDGAGRYLLVNHTLVLRCGRAAKADVIGKTGGAFFPAELAQAVHFLQKNFAWPLSTAPLAEKAALAAGRFGQLVKRIFHLRRGR